MSDRNQLISQLNTMLKRIVVLSNHLRDNAEPYESYVHEKMNSVPILDSENRIFYDDLRMEILEFCGVMLEG